jgi:hypothetical protein
MMQCGIFLLVAEALAYGSNLAHDRGTGVSSRSATLGNVAEGSPAWRTDA